MSAIQARGLVKTFTDRSGTVEAVRGVDIDVAPGEIFAFLGPNGAGKSTTVRMLTTLTTISGGTATVGGFDVATQADSVRRTIGAWSVVPFPNMMANGPAHAGDIVTCES